ncbi:MAG: PHP domain-containing protein [Candidatus Aminicenantes bacterium]|nr:PHP domain-containing protein [Candidatus Aminicenantes bacterium]
MRGLVDLHIHSNKSSDGDFTPFHLVRLARECGFQAISIADHDTVAAYPKAVEYGEKDGVEVVPNIELTTLFDDREFHLLLPFVDWKSRVLHSLIKRIYKRRIEEGQERVNRLKKLDFDINWKRVTGKTGANPPLGVTIAQVLLEDAGEKDSRLKKYLEGNNRDFAPYFFYRDYFMTGKPAFVPKKNIDLLEVMDEVPQTGGVPVLAHPGAYFQLAQEEDIKRLKEAGLQGMEVYTSYHDEEQTVFYKKLAEDLDLVPTAGSDFHGRVKPHITFGSMKKGEYWMVEELLKRKKNEHELG